MGSQHFGGQSQEEVGLEQSEPASVRVLPLGVKEGLRNAGAIKKEIAFN